MIRNERQCDITRKAIASFLASRAAMEAAPSDTYGLPGGDLLRRAALSSIDAQVGDLHAELEEWASLRAGVVREFTVAGWDELPKVLVRARIARGMTPDQLDRRLSLPEGQVERWEAENYEHADFWRIIEAAGALGLVLSGKALLDDAGDSPST